MSAKVGQLIFGAMQRAKAEALAASATRSNPSNDVKSAAGDIYVYAKRHLQLTGCGNDQMAFARNVLAPLIKPTMAVYRELRKDIFG